MKDKRFCLAEKYIQLARLAELEEQKDMYIQKAVCLLETIEATEYIPTIENLDNLMIESKIMDYLESVYETSPLDIWINCLNQPKNKYRNREAYWINSIIHSTSEWDERRMIRFKHDNLNYSGRGYRKKIMI